MKKQRVYHSLNHQNKEAKSTTQTTIILTILTLALIVGAFTYLAAFLSGTAGAFFNFNGQIIGPSTTANGPGWGFLPGNFGLFNGTGVLQPSVFNAFPQSAAAAFLTMDNPSLGPDSSVYLQKSFNNQPVSCSATITSCWQWGTGNNQAKDQLANVYVYAAIPASGPRANHLIMFVGLERITTSGDSHIDLEFFQAPVALTGGTGPGGTAPCPTTPTTPCTFTGTRTNGDFIVSMDFTVGGSLGGVTTRNWTGTAYSSPIETLTAPAICTSDGNTCGQNNNATINSGPWPTYGTKGVIPNCATGTPCLPPNQFTEVGVDVTAETHGTPCVATFLPKTRSSQSFTASLQDFAGPVSFPLCGAHISIAPNGLNQVGAPHTFTVTVTKQQGTQILPAVGVPVTVKLTNSNGAIASVSTNTCASPGTNGAGQCIVTFTSATGGVVTGTANATVVILGTPFPVKTDGQNGNSGPATKRFVDAFIKIGPSAVNQVGVPHTFTITVKQDNGNGSGFLNAPDGTKPLVTLTNGGGANFVISTNTCSGTGTTAGTCSVTFTSSTAGTVTGTATVTFNIATPSGSISVTRSTDATGNNSGPAIKRFVDAFITIGPNDTNSIFENHTFTITVQADTGSGFAGVSGTMPTVTLTPSGATLINVVNTCPSGTNISGQCTVTFTSSTAGTVTGHATVTFSITTAQGTISLTRSTDGVGKNSGDAVKTFVSGTISWIKVDNVGNPLGGATFQVCRIANFVSDSNSFTAINPLCFSVLDNTSPDTNPASGFFTVTNMILGNYTIHETIAPPGFTPDPATVQVSLTLSSPNASITTPFSNLRPILKLTGFGYTNTLTSTPSQCQTTCTVSGIVTYNLTFTNFGSAAGVMNFTFIVSINIPAGDSGTLSCSGGNTLTMTGVTVTAGASVAFLKSCNYTATSPPNTLTPVSITADLNATYNTAPGDSLIRVVNGCPAEVKFSVQPN